MSLQSRENPPTPAPKTHMGIVEVGAMRSRIWALSFLTLAVSCTTGKRNINTESRISESSPIMEEPPTSTVGSYRLARQVSMFYKVDLRQDNAHSSNVAASIRNYDASVRNCYTHRLDEAPNLKGNVELTFAISKSSKKVSDLNHVGGTIRDRAMLGCLKQQLAAIPMSPPPHDLKGNLVFSFDYKLARADGH